MPPRVRLLLRVWAGKVERNLLSKADAAELAKLLRRFADGESIDDAFGIWRPANRPTDPTLAQRHHEMAVMRLSVELGGEGKSYRETIDEIARRYNKSPETIEEDYKSDRAKRVRSEVKASGELAKAAGAVGKWQGGKTSDLSPPPQDADPTYVAGPIYGDLL